MKRGFTDLLIQQVEDVNSCKGYTHNNVCPTIYYILKGYREKSHLPEGLNPEVGQRLQMQKANDQVDLLPLQ